MQNGSFAQGGVANKRPNQERSPHSSGQQLVLSGSQAFARTRETNPLDCQQAWTLRWQITGPAGRCVFSLSCCLLAPLDCRAFATVQSQDSSLLLESSSPNFSSDADLQGSLLHSVLLHFRQAFLTPLVTTAAVALITFTLLILPCPYHSVTRVISRKAAIGLLVLGLCHWHQCLAQRRQCMFNDWRLKI